MDKKTIGTLVCAVGVVLLAVSLLADSLGLGGAAGIGRDQILGSVAGVVIAVVGVFLRTRK